MEKVRGSWRGKTYRFLSRFSLSRTITSTRPLHLGHPSSYSILFSDASPVQLVQVIKVLIAQLHESPCSAVGSFCGSRDHRLLLIVEEPPQAVVVFRLEESPPFWVDDWLG